MEHPGSTGEYDPGCEHFATVVIEDHGDHYENVCGRCGYILEQYPKGQD